MSDGLINIENISMMFNLSREKVDNIKEYFIRKVKKDLSFREFWALKNINFTVSKGDKVGIVGLNGSGKSTLLKLIAGVLKPTKGKVTVKGTIAPLIELGAGFDYDLTARENIYLNGAILGYSHKEMGTFYNEIIAFSELQEFQDVAIKNFSSGMISRLGFAIATCKIPDVLIVDEILSVGDYAFQQKCQERMQEMTSAGTTILFVSHSIDQVKKICNRGIWLKQGHLQMVGDINEVCDAFLHDHDNNTAIIVNEKEPKEEFLKVHDAPIYHEKYQFITLLSVIATVLIMYGHMIPFILRGMGTVWEPMEVIQNYITSPLGIIQDFGFLGITLLFLITGFLTAMSIKNHNIFSFWLSGIKKIFPGLICSVTFLYFFQWGISLYSGTTSYWGQFDFFQWFYSATLMNYILGIPNLINGVTWYLGVLLFFYFLQGALLPIGKKNPHLYLLISISFCILSLLMAPSLPDVLYSYAASIAYIPIILFGQLLYFIWNKKMGGYSFAFYSIVMYVLMIRNISYFFPTYQTVNEKIGISMIYGCFLFIISLLLNYRIRIPKTIDKLSNISFLLYLNHMPISQLLLPIFVLKVNTTISLIFVVIILFITVLVQNFILKKIKCA